MSIIKFILIFMGRFMRVYWLLHGLERELDTKLVLRRWARSRPVRFLCQELLEVLRTQDDKNRTLQHHPESHIKVSKIKKMVTN